MFLTKNGLLFFDIEKWLWKYNFGTFWGPGAMSIHKTQQFHLITVDFWTKTLIFRTQQVRNSMTQLTLIWDMRHRFIMVCYGVPWVICWWVRWWTRLRWFVWGSFGGLFGKLFSGLLRIHRGEFIGCPWDWKEVNWILMMPLWQVTTIHIKSSPVLVSSNSNGAFKQQDPKYSNPKARWVKMALKSDPICFKEVATKNWPWA